METIPEKPSGPFENPTNALLVPPLHAVPRSKTGRKPQRSSPLAGPAVLVSDTEDTSGPLIISSSPIQGHNSNSLSPPTLRPRPKSMAFDYSTRPLNPQSLTPRSRPHAPGTKQIIRPISSVLPFSATQEHFSNADSSCSREYRNFGERCENSGYRNPLPLARTNSLRVSPTATSRPPIIVLDGTPIDVDVPQTPPSARSSSRMTETMPRPNSWYIASEYDATPKFSRLGLSADSVILPVSAKDYKKCQHQRQRYSTNSDGSLSKGPSLKKRSSIMMASTLKLASRPFTSTSSDLQLAQEPSTSSSPSSRTSTTSAESDSSPTSATSSSFPHSGIPRTRTSSFTTSSSSSYTCFMPDIVTPSSRTSINEETTEDLKGHQREGNTFSISSRKDQSKSMFASKIKHRTTGQLALNPESIMTCPVVDKDEKKLRRGSVMRRFVRLFIPS